MNKQNGFTAIEVMIIIVILGIVIATAMPAFQKDAAKRDGIAKSAILNSPNSIILTPTAPEVKSNCNYGYVILPNGSQLIDKDGHGVQCQ